MTTCTRMAAGIACCVVYAASAQVATAKFEVASVKLSTNCGDSDARGGRGAGGGVSSSPERLDLKCRTLLDLIQMAYGQFAAGTRRPPTRGIPVESGPAWMKSDRYDIDAKAEGAQSQEMMRGPMLQALLEERFQLKIHHDTRDVSVYALIVAKGGPKLQVAKEGNCFLVDRDHPLPPPAKRPVGLMPCGVFTPSRAKDGVYMYSTTLENFCVQLSLALDRPVIDKTGIEGIFDIHVDPPSAEPDPGVPGDGTPPVAAAAPDLESAVSTSVQKIGLKLESTKGPGEFLVIDRVERPSGN